MIIKQAVSVQLIHGVCTVDTWCLYSWYMVSVQLIHVVILW